MQSCHQPQGTVKEVRSKVCGNEANSLSSLIPKPLSFLELGTACAGGVGPWPPGHLD